MEFENVEAAPPALRVRRVSMDASLEPDAVRPLSSESVVGLCQGVIQQLVVVEGYQRGGRVRGEGLEQKIVLIAAAACRLFVDRREDDVLCGAREVGVPTRLELAEELLDVQLP